jgi:hypothetical protein
MPARVIDVLRPEDKAAMGYIKDALKDVRNELKQLERDALKTMTKGGEVDKTTAQRMGHLQGQAETYEAKLAEQKRLDAAKKVAQQQTKLTVGELLRQTRGGGGGGAIGRTLTRLTNWILDGTMTPFGKIGAAERCSGISIDR